MATDIIEKAQRMLEKRALCSNCLGRQFALLGYGVDNKQRGEAIKLVLTMKAHRQTLSNDKRGFALLKTLASNANFHMATDILGKMRKKTSERQQCYLCKGHLDSLNGLVSLALGMLKDYEYSTFLVGIELPVEIEEREDEFKSKFTIKHAESLRNDFSRNLGKKIADATGKATEYARPDIVVLASPFEEKVSLQVNPIHVRGRYRKLVRGIPQSRWFCSHCRGKGCSECNWTGKKYSESVEEIVGNPALDVTQGEDIAFHGAGREDIDARMLGRGRPFVIEVKKPRKRQIDLKKLTYRINEIGVGKVNVSNLRFADKDEVRRIKRGEAAQKLYKAVVELDNPVSDDELAVLERELSGSVIKQQTPQRVAHRRANLVREKYIYKANVKRLTPNRFEIRIRCQGGLYIKELITGDQDRTLPSISAILSVKALPIELDVLGVYLEGEE